MLDELDVFIFPLCLFASLTLLSVGYRRLLRWHRSVSLQWPLNLSSVEQAEICRKYFLRSGIDAYALRSNRAPFNLELRRGDASVLISLKGGECVMSEGRFREIRESILRSERGRVPLVVVSEPDLWGAIGPANPHGVPIIHRSRLRDLPALLNSPPSLLLSELQAISLTVKAASSAEGGASGESFWRRAVTALRVENEGGAERAPGPF